MLAESSTLRRASTGGARLATFIAFALIIVFVLGRIPTPDRFASDSDWGHQLAGANQISWGEHPFADWRSTYGPLTFYASWTAQQLTGWRPIGEIALCFGGYLVGYWLLYRCASRLGGPVAALMVLALAVLAMPRTYKYYVLLLPLLCLFLAFRYIERPGSPRLVILGFAIGVAALFRHDLGAFALASALVAICIAPATWTSYMARLARLMLGILLAVAPWLLYLALRGSASNYFRDALLGSARHAGGQSLPIPMYDPSRTITAYENVSAMLYLLAFLTPLLCLIWLIVRRRDFSSAHNVKLWTATALALCSLAQALHRAEYNHLLQAMPAGLALLAFLLSGGLRWLSSPGLRAVAGAFILASYAVWLAAAYIAVKHNAQLPTLNATRVASSIGRLAQPRALFTQELLAIPDTRFQTAVLSEILDRTRPTDRILALPLLTHYYYLTGRRFGGGQMLVMNGYFSSPGDQQLMISRMMESPPALVALWRSHMLDNDPSRTMASFAPRLLLHLDQAYQTGAVIGPVEVLTLRPPTRQVLLPSPNGDRVSAASQARAES